MKTQKVYLLLPIPNLRGYHPIACSGKPNPMHKGNATCTFRCVGRVPMGHRSVLTYCLLLWLEQAIGWLPLRICDWSQKVDLLNFHVHVRVSVAYHYKTLLHTLHKIDTHTYSVTQSHDSVIWNKPIDIFPTSIVYSS